MASQLATTERPESTAIAVSPEADRFALLQRQARMFAFSPLVPDHLRKGPPEVAMANCYIALTLAEAMGEVPLIVMQNIHFVHGQAGFRSEYKIARANRSGIFVGRIDWRVDKSDPKNLKVEAYATLKDTGEEVSFECDMEMARAEGWTSNKKYQTMPEVMLRYRSASFLIRFYAGDVMLGYRTIEELEDIIASSEPANPLTAQMLTDQAASSRTEDARVAQIVDEPPANDGTLADDNPAATEGRTDEQHGDQHDGNDDTPKADALIARIEAAEIVADVNSIAGEAADLAPDQAKRVSDAAKAARAALTAK